MKRSLMGRGGAKQLGYTTRLPDKVASLHLSLLR